METDALNAMKFETFLNDILVESEDSGKLVLPAEESFQFCQNHNQGQSWSPQTFSPEESFRR